MNDTLFEIRKTSRFAKDYRFAKKHGENMQLIKEIIQKLADGMPLLEKNRDHALNGEWFGCRECYVTPNWLLVYQREGDILVLTLTRKGSHSDLVL